MQLRYYQREAIDAAYLAMRSPDPSLVVLPTGAGKSAVIATAAREMHERWQARVLIVSHVKELLEQLHNTIIRTWPLAPVGLYSAGLGSRETNQPVIIGGIQSIYKRACDLGRFDVMLVDECHLMPHKDEGMYAKLYSDLLVINPQMRLLGLTATDYRMDVGRIHGRDKLFKSIAYEIGVRKLIDEGFLCKLRGKAGGAPDLSAVHIRGGEYKPDELEAAMADQAKVTQALDDIQRFSADRNAWLIFCCGVAHAKMVFEELQRRGIPSAIVLGDTPSTERAGSIAKYKAKQLRCLVSVGVLTTGFDAPHVDLIALMRPTLSAGLYYQMVGRGLRTSPDKQDCMILDFAGCIEEHGPVDAIEIRERKQGKGKGEAPTKSCPECWEVIPASATVCHICGHEMPREHAKHETEAHDVSPLVNYQEEEYDVIGMDWRVHTKKGGETKTLRLVYKYGLHQEISEYICLEHEGWARRKAEAWWKENGPGPCPMTCVEAFDLLENEPPRKPSKIVVRIGGKWPELVSKSYSYQPVEEVPF